MSDDPTRAILDAVQQWAQRNLPAPASGHGGPECQWCPLCQLASMLRGENPEVLDGLAESFAALLTAARALLETVSTVSTVSTANEQRPRPRPRPKPGRVQPIKIEDE